MKNPKWVTTARRVLRIPDEQVKNFDDNLLTQLINLSDQLGKFDNANTRINKLKQWVSQKLPHSTEKFSKGFISGIIGISFSNAIQYQTDGLGPLSPIISWVLATALCFGLDTLAIKVFTSIRCDKNLEQALKTIDFLKEHDPPANELAETYFKAQKVCIQLVEGNLVEPILKTDVCLALAITGLEYCAALYIINQFSLGRGALEEVMKFLTAALPSAAVWLAALVQSRVLDMPKYAAAAVEGYERILDELTAADTEGETFQEEDKYGFTSRLS